MDPEKIEICFQQRCQDRARVKNYFDVADDSFKPKLSSRLDVKAYVDKICNYASLIWCMYEGRDIGLCAFYANRPPMAFITSLSVLEEYQGYGLAKRLLEEMVERCTQNGFKKITLEVYKANTRAQQLYLKMGFAFSTKDDEKYVMQKTDLNLLW
ncbi:MAG TPA: GNAT family N-acetyltransferase [Candidatus Fournierella pullicola]|uniref:GNAT family N-acetyltransferase n=1 Tax=Candidatus Allofournierella pullicola TaxID=2838596 RepID=A0A9D1V434_9FIRM|nr:GNAT family N-acetyltransferase [Candidatus Fournierella pullicola]